MGQNTFYRKVLLQLVIEITARSLEVCLTDPPHGIPYILESEIAATA